MLLHLDFACDIPIYKQIRDQIVLGIADGHLAAGEKLPTIRALANETGVNIMTINKAYQLLKHEGYINADRRGGTVVSGVNASLPVETVLEGLKAPAASAKLSGVSREIWLVLCAQAYDILHNNNEERGY